MSTISWILVSLIAFHFQAADAFTSIFKQNVMDETMRVRSHENHEISGAKTYTPDDSPNIQRLWEHLIEVEECEGLELLEAGFHAQTHLRGLYTKEKINAGEYICAIPFVSSLLVNERFFAGATNAGDVQMTSHTAVNTESWQDFSNNEKYQHYLDCLPGLNGDPNFTPTADFWDDSEIQELQVPVLVGEMMERKHQVEEEASKIEGALLIELQHAMWTIRTRAFTTLKKAVDLDAREGLLQRTVLIPALDLLNHNSQNSNAVMEVVESKEYDESFYALVAKRDIDAGEELCIRYGTGKDSSIDIYSKYGFWPSDNEENDLHCVGEWKTDWATTLEQDRDELLSLKSSETDERRQSILDFRIRMKELLKKMNNIV